MNRLQEQLLENANELPKRFLQELLDFSEFLKQKVRNQAFKKRMEASEKDIEEGRVETVTPEELFSELGI
jgi:vancomycin permeability regulator SanA